MQISPILDTIFGFFEKDLLPIIELEPFDLISKTGRVLMFTPIDFNKKDVWSVKIL